MDFIVILLLVAAPCVAFGLAAWLVKRSRRAAIAAWARENGWEFAPGKRAGRDLPFTIFRRGTRRYSRHHLERIFPGATPGLDAAHAELFEYHHVEKSDNRADHRHFTCALVAPGLDLEGTECRLADPGWSVETAGRRLLAHRSGRPDVRRLERLSELVIEFLAGIPLELVNAERGKRGQYPLRRAGGETREGTEETG